MWHLFGSSRPVGPSSPRWRFRPGLEALEERCVPTAVMNLNDSGSGSLRDALASTPAGGTVTFAAGLRGTILLTSASLTITQNVTVTAPVAGVISVSGGGKFGVFRITGGGQVSISDLSIINGNAPGDGGGIDVTVVNAIQLSLSICTLKGNTA